MENVSVWIDGDKYLAVKDLLGMTYVNLTWNDICAGKKDSFSENAIIPVSGHIAYVSGNRIVGLPNTTENIIFVVGYEVFQMSKRDDLCVSLVAEPYDDQMILVPLAL